MPPGSGHILMPAAFPLCAWPCLGWSGQAGHSLWCVVLMPLNSGRETLMSEGSGVRRLAFRSELCSLGLSFSSCIVGRALCSSKNTTTLSGCFTREEGVILY